ncbi:MAG: hypothetical protein P0Y64_02635 [Candidatus Sphingomonas colombiensis]|nr:hypothetical protein [Sphingomonas sp.]WEK43745.1 MAG: hypothetical protein P0Y64_02635 [Sphingomonas sp.]
MNDIARIAVLRGSRRSAREKFVDRPAQYFSGKGGPVKLRTLAGDKPRDLRHPLCIPELSAN